MSLHCHAFSFVLHLMRRNRVGDRGNVHSREQRSLVEEFCFKTISTIDTFLLTIDCTSVERITFLQTGVMKFRY